MSRSVFQSYVDSLLIACRQFENGTRSFEGMNAAEARFNAAYLIAVADLGETEANRIAAPLFATYA